MKTDKKLIKNLIVGMVLVVILIALYIWGDQISPTNKGTAYEVEKLVRSSIIAFIGLVLLRLIIIVFITPYEKKRGIHVHNIIKDVIGFIVLFIATIIIVTHVYGSSVSTMLAYLTGAIVGVGWIIQDFLKQLVAGLIIDFQSEFRVGDWIKLQDGTLGKIDRIKLTRTEILLVNNTMLYINNNKILESVVINLNQPDTPFFNCLSVVLEHSVPVERARRILTAAIIDCPDIYEKTAFVCAESAQQNGIVYDIFFKMPNQDNFFEIRHQIISSITQHLHNHDLKLCQISGEIKVHNVDNIPILFDDSEVTNELNTLKLSGLLKGCADTLQKQFAKKMEKLHFNTGETIVSEGEVGDTMFIVAEGVVEVFVSVFVEEKTSSNKVATLSDGDYLGEMSLLQGEPRNATVIAQTSVVIYQINRETIKSFVSQYPDFARKLSESIIARHLENETIKSDAIEKLSKKEKTVSEFIDSFKKFLGI